MYPLPSKGSVYTLVKSTEKGKVPITIGFQKMFSKNGLIWTIIVIGCGKTNVTASIKQLETKIF